MSNAETNAKRYHDSRDDDCEIERCRFRWRKLTWKSSQKWKWILQNEYSDGNEDVYRNSRDDDWEITNVHEDGNDEGDTDEVQEYRSRDGHEDSEEVVDVKRKIRWRWNWALSWQDEDTFEEEDDTEDEHENGNAY